MSRTAELPELTPDERVRMEELRPLVEEAFVTVLSLIAEDGLREEMRAMTQDLRERADRSERLVAEAEATLARAEQALRR